MRHFFSTRIRVVLILALLLAGGLGVLSAVTGKSIPSVVVQGVLQHVSAEELELLDGRRNRHAIPVADVEEVIYDIEAPY